MALSSMTGFARQAGTLPDGTGFVWELRSVNGRGLDVRLRLPPGPDMLEPRLREAAVARFRRGNISATLSMKREDRPAPRLTPDPVALEQALALALEVAARIPGCPPPRAESILAMPGVLRSEVPEAREEEAEARNAAITAGFQQALDDLATARQQEGEKLSGILHALLDEIAELRERAVALAAEQPAAHRARLSAALAELLEGERRVPEERLAIEVALLAQKSDVREELDRLGAHIAAARALLAGGEPAGRRLEFLTQEFGREVNTLGAKSASLGLTSLSLDLKAAIERLREQAANVE
ncbi:YicC/YloC family endoribonuclease [Roseomonas marmotae]|uniref:YicC family protein n=1 Tax=Roseomonas marmotae TaxID=2768161 RepID=A0ABS3KE37_9PROT|nr:YicC/YloC family endoribonuclease [Roseomonas marmotae]MBO1075731.1 YicC family protein [Roseomonas marmotae]QTI80461.1 YicC family protein [Roseomonas marmotae]